VRFLGLPEGNREMENLQSQRHGGQSDSCTSVLVLAGVVALSEAGGGNIRLVEAYGRR
jgi:hypothetical protein